MKGFPKTFTNRYAKDVLHHADWYEIAASMVEDYVSDHPEVLAS